MENKNALAFFEKLGASSENNPKIVKFKGKDLTQFDANFILEYINSDTSILDIGTGTGLIVNKIYNKTKSITCIEPVINLSKHIIKADNIKIINKNIFDFETNEKYDLITIFGTMHYFNEKEALSIYKKCYDFIKQNGKLIIKNQFGLKEDVTVSGYSEEQETNYFAQYRLLDKEINMLNKIGFINTKAIDVYPPEANRWNNTHFYAIITEK